MSVHISKNRIRATGADAHALFQALTEPQPRVKVREFLGADVMCLHAVCQPVATDMQNAIRFQRQQLDQCAEALHYVLNRIKREDEVRKRLGCGSEVYERLTAALANITDRDVDALRDHYIPGSAAIHRSHEEDEE